MPIEEHRVILVYLRQHGARTHVRWRVCSTDRLRRIRYKDPETGKVLVFLTNNFDLPAHTIAQLYKCRWQVELFFKWIKQNLRIKHFFGNSDNAVKTQTWIAVSIYVLVAIVRKQLAVELSLSQLLQVLSVNMFEQIPLAELLARIQTQDEPCNTRNQLMLWQ
jgi:IS4 transposase